MSFNEKLQKLRKEYKLSQEDLADKLDVTRQSVSKWESGQTYPEMDKLLSICKIFNCTLEELTNDEIKEIKPNIKKNTINSIIDNGLDIINRTYHMFIKMTAKDVIKCVFTMFIVAMILLLFKIPIEYLQQGFYRMITSVGHYAIADFLSSLINIILDITYCGVYILIFIYIFKIGFLDKTVISKESISDPLKKSNIVENNSDEKKVDDKPVKITKAPSENNYPIFGVLGKVIIFGLKILLIFFTIPFIGLIIGFNVALVIDIYLIIKGVIFISILIGLIFAIVFNALLLELMFNILFNKPHSYKRMLITFIICVCGIGASIGLFTIDINSITYYSQPAFTADKIKDYEYNFDSNMIIQKTGYQGKDIKYVVDNTLANKVKLSINYNKDFQNVFVLESGNEYFVYSDSIYNYHKIINVIIENLKSKKFHNINNLYEYNLTVTTSENNIAVLKNNYNNYLNKNMEDQYNGIISTYENDIYEKDSQINKLQEEINNLQEENEQFKNELNDYKNRVSDLLD